MYSYMGAHIGANIYKTKHQVPPIKIEMDQYKVKTPKELAEQKYFKITGKKIPRKMSESLGKLLEQKPNPTDICIPSSDNEMNIEVYYDDDVSSLHNNGYRLDKDGNIMIKTESKLSPAYFDNESKIQKGYKPLLNNEINTNINNLGNSEINTNINNIRSEGESNSNINKIKEDLSESSHDSASNDVEYKESTKNSKINTNIKNADDSIESKPPANDIRSEREIKPPANNIRSEREIKPPANNIIIESESESSDISTNIKNPGDTLKEAKIKYSKCTNQKMPDKMEDEINTLINRNGEAKITSAKKINGKTEVYLMYENENVNYYKIFENGNGEIYIPGEGIKDIKYGQEGEIKPPANNIIIESKNKNNNINSNIKKPGDTLKEAKIKYSECTNQEMPYKMEDEVNTLIYSNGEAKKTFVRKINGKTEVYLMYENEDVNYYRIFENGNGEIYRPGECIDDVTYWRVNTFKVPDDIIKNPGDTLKQAKIKYTDYTNQKMPDKMEDEIDALIYLNGEAKKTFVQKINGKTEVQLIYENEDIEYYKVFENGNGEVYKYNDIVRNIEYWRADEFKVPNNNIIIESESESSDISTNIKNPGDTLKEAKIKYSKCTNQKMPDKMEDEINTLINRNGEAKITSAKKINGKTEVYLMYENENVNYYKIFENGNGEIYIPGEGIKDIKYGQEGEIKPPANNIIIESKNKNNNINSNIKKPGDTLKEAKIKYSECTNQEMPYKMEDEVNTLIYSNGEAKKTFVRKINGKTEVYLMYENEDVNYYRIFENGNGEIYRPGECIDDVTYWRVNTFKVPDDIIKNPGDTLKQAKIKYTDYTNQKMPDKMEDEIDALIYLNGEAKKTFVQKINGKTEVQLIYENEDIEYYKVFENGNGEVYKYNDIVRNIEYWRADEFKVPNNNIIIESESKPPANNIIIEEGEPVDKNPYYDQFNGQITVKKNGNNMKKSIENGYIYKSYEKPRVGAYSTDSGLKKFYVIAKDQEISTGKAKYTIMLNKDSIPIKVPKESINFNI